MVVIINGDARLLPLADETVQCVITSPPYWGMRDYRVDDQIGLEDSPGEYVRQLVEAFREVWRVLREDGVVWLNLGDSYAGSWGNYGARSGKQRTRVAERWHRRAYEDPRLGWTGLPPTARVGGLKPKDLVGIPWRVAFALQADGWYLRQDIIWHKENPLPESVKDRCTRAHEYVFLLAKSRRYYFNAEAIAEPAVGGSRGLAATFRRPQSVRGESMVPGNTATHRPDRELVEYGGPMRNKRSVWTVPVARFKGAHFATFPPELVEPMVLAGSRRGDVILDPFAGAATVGLVALRHGRRFVGVELNRQYVDLARERLRGVQMELPLMELTLVG